MPAWRAASSTFRVPVPFSSVAHAGWACTSLTSAAAARWQTAAQPRTARWTSAGRSTSPITVSTVPGACQGDGRVSRIRTRWPAAVIRSTTWEPMKPAPPVTRTIAVMGTHASAPAAARVPAGVRVLVFSADIGEGHDLPARVLRDGILARRPDAEVVVLDALAVAGPVGQALVRRGSELILGRLRALFDVQYWLVGRFPPTRALATRLAARLGSPLVAAVAAHRPDVVVSTY